MWEELKGHMDGYNKFLSVNQLIPTTYNQKQLLMELAVSTL
jgi:hypothetical protein